MTNTPAYFGKELITAVNKFIIQVPGQRARGREGKRNKQKRERERERGK